LRPTIKTYDTAATQKLAQARDFKMPDESTDPQTNGANDPEPQDFDENALTSIEDTQIGVLDAVGNPEDFNQLIANFLSSITPDDIDNLARGFPYENPRPPVATSNYDALQSYLVQMQILGGIPPEEIEPMRTGPPRRGGHGPVFIRYDESGCMVPYFPPAAFNGTLLPLFHRGYGPQPSNDQGSDDAVSFISLAEEREKLSPSLFEFASQALQALNALSMN
jgi:hypothetical protein